MNFSTRTFLIALAVAVATTSVSSFSTVSPVLRSSTTTIPSIRNVGLIRASTAAGNSDGAVTNKIIKQLERDEAKMIKKREAAMEKLNKVEASLNQLQSKKQEYLNGSKLDSTPAANFSETTGRSAVKALMWRVIAGSVTFITSFKFSGSVATALSIVGSDFLSKSFTMFIGERLMNKSQAGRKSGADGAGRSLMKALVWRLFAICNTLTMAIFIAKDISIASKIAGSDAIFKTALMFVYERVWAKIEWGKEYQVEYNL
ncbi:unnamed protein product [Pseudo-nitzschia multistriata]|uniref:DUF2061 domain-containing protein n=1 Tax=Pseudo-nitzschia multistriata TaxID=183589 RepID=A0A448ZGE6_9STRA|nr:unnamed protein product [Pseudo-nitzschia multistriata]